MVHPVVYHELYPSRGEQVDDLRWYEAFAIEQPGHFAGLRRMQIRMRHRRQIAAKAAEQAARPQVGPIVAEALDVAYVGWTPPAVLKDLMRIARERLFDDVIAALCIRYVQKRGGQDFETFRDGLGISVQQILLVISNCGSDEFKDATDSPGLPPSPREPGHVH